LRYVRFWIVKTLIRLNPLVVFVGSPLYVLYLRALGAKIGRDVAIFTQNVPVCTDLLTIGEGTVIGKDSFLSCYRAHAGLIQTGPVTLGKHVVVSEVTVLDIGASMGDGAQLGHASTLYAGQRVPAGQSWHGSPAQPADVDYRGLASVRLSIVRRFLFCVVDLLIVLGVVLPLPVGGAFLLFTRLPQLAALLQPGRVVLTDWAFYAQVLTVSYVVFFCGVLVGLVFVSTFPRLLSVIIKPDKIYRLYGLRYWAHRAISVLTNLRFFTQLFGDSSYIVGYLRALGYDLGQVEQTGSNFGMDVRHDSPYLSSVGRGTVVSDGLSMINTSYSNTSFRVTRVTIGARNFLGNRIAYPSNGKTGGNCLLATKVMVPIDGRVREGVGLLGSPSFEIPRTVARDAELDVTDPWELARGLGDKNRHNVVTMGLFLLVQQWIPVFLFALLALAALNHYGRWGAWAIVLVSVLTLVVTVVYYALVERAVRGLMALRPAGCSIYDRAFWRHERFWKVASVDYVQLFNGTPYKNLVWRLLGVRIGRQVFDDGLSLTERRFVTIGDHCTINAGTHVQCHSQEDGAFKSNRSAIGSRCTLGVGAFIHYGVSMGDGAILETDSFLMKGEEIPDGERWGGNPARELRT
jgi:non-ribosomal peptide synthetase-like protein